MYIDFAFQCEWLASTLNPNYEGNELSQMVPDDRFIRYTLKDWFFGDDFTGDITQFYNYTSLLSNAFCQEKVSCFFFTIISQIEQKVPQ